MDTADALPYGPNAARPVRDAREQITLWLQAAAEANKDGMQPLVQLIEQFGLEVEDLTEAGLDYETVRALEQLGTFDAV
ncbi:MAG: hypothetical protein VKJ06_06835 [Vampirovibrionales bacterium]|nr:hypothetical protein [Vampirovibrionales bacterium]